MKKLILPIIVLSLMGCATPQKVISDAYSKCPQIGINVAAPDFHQKHKKAEINQFYICMETALQPSNKIPVFGQDGSPGRSLLSALNQNSDIKASLQPMLEYQRNLWLEVISKEKKPGAAYEAWVAWLQNEQNVEAANRSANAAENSANTARNAAIQQNADMMQQNMELEQIRQQQFMQNSINQGVR